MASINLNLYRTILMMLKLHDELLKKLCQGVIPLEFLIIGLNLVT